ncbi:MAG: hypothetical protein ABIJ09_19560 [Pseudomonadota bacterium]
MVRRARTRRGRPGRARGYLLIEAMISTGIMAVVLASTMQLMANARFRLGKARNPEVASAVALSLAEELAGNPHVTVAATAWAPVPGKTGFEWKWSETTSGLHTASTPNLASSDTLHEIRVWVRYPSERGPLTVSYRLLKRKKLN